MCRLVPSSYLLSIWKKKKTNLDEVDEVHDAKRETMPRQRITPLMLRLPEKLHRRLVQLARSNQRSLNNELVSRLERTVAAEDPLPPEVEQMLARIGESMKRRDQLEAELARALIRVAPKELKKVIGRVYGEESKS